MRTKKDINAIKNLFLEKFKDAGSELKFGNLYELLVCVMLSAQCTDKRVNLITPSLFEAYPDIASLAQANLASVKALINSCSFFNNKAENLIKMAKSVMSEFDEIVGRDMLCGMHINDTKFDLASKKDRHESLGKGFLGLKTFENIINDPRTDDIPLVLETIDESIWADEIKILRNFKGE